MFFPYVTLSVETIFLDLDIHFKYTCPHVPPNKAYFYLAKSLLWSALYFKVMNHRDMGYEL